MSSAKTQAHTTSHHVARDEEYSYRDDSSCRAPVRMSTVTMARRLPTPAFRAPSQPRSGGAL